MEDFNADHAKIDAALAAQAESQSALAAQMANCGNCKIMYQTYTGTGKCNSSNPNTLNFETAPLIIFITGYDGKHLCMISGHTSALLDTAYPVSITWNGTSVSWYSTYSQYYQCNQSGSTYYVVALCAAD